MKRVQCSHVVEGPKIDGRGNVAWRRKCKRIVPEGETYCWQHKRAAS